MYDSKTNSFLLNLSRESSYRREGGRTGSKGTFSDGELQTPKDFRPHSLGQEYGASLRSLSGVGWSGRRLGLSTADQQAYLSNVPFLWLNPNRAPEQLMNYTSYCEKGKNIGLNLRDRAAMRRNRLVRDFQKTSEKLHQKQYLSEAMLMAARKRHREASFQLARENPIDFQLGSNVRRFFPIHSHPSGRCDPILSRTDANPKASLHPYLFDKFPSRDEKRSQLFLTEPPNITSRNSPMNRFHSSMSNPLKKKFFGNNDNKSLHDYEVIKECIPHVLGKKKHFFYDWAIIRVPQFSSGWNKRAQVPRLGKRIPGSSLQFHSRNEPAKNFESLASDQSLLQKKKFIVIQRRDLLLEKTIRDPLSCL